MKKQMKWLLPLLLVSGAAYADEQPATPSPTAEEMCELPLAESAEERAVQQAIRAMTASLAESLPANMDEIITIPAAEVRQEILASLNEIPAEDQTDAVRDLIAQVEESEIQVSEDQMVEMAEAIKCALYADYDSLKSAAAQAIAAAAAGEGTKYIALANINYFGLDIGFALINSKVIPLIKRLPISSRLGFGFEISVGANVGIGFSSTGPVVTFRPAAGMVGAGLLAGGVNEKLIVPRVMLPINNFRFFGSPSFQDSMDSFYGTYGTAGAVTMDLGPYNLRGQLGYQVAGNAGAPVFMASLGTTIGQQASKFLANGRLYRFDNLANVLQFLADLFGNGEGEPSAFTQFLDEEFSAGNTAAE